MVGALWISHNAQSFDDPAFHRPAEVFKPTILSIVTYISRLSQYYFSCTESSHSRGLWISLDLTMPFLLNSRRFFVEWIDLTIIMTERNIKIGIVGFGTVGCGVAKLILESSDAIAAKTGLRLELACIVDIDTESPRPVTLPKDLLSDDLDRLLKDAENENYGLDGAWGVI